MDTSRLIILGFLAGVYLAFGGVLMTKVKLGASAYVGSGLANLFGGAAFSFGLMLVVLGGAELLTGNSLVLIGYFNGTVSLQGIARNWIAVYTGNILGGLTMVGLMYMSGLYDTSTSAATGGISMKGLGIQIAAVKANLGWNEANLLQGWSQAFSRAILCNWLVCMALWLAKSADEAIGKMAACFFPAMAFIAIGFEHSIANWFLIPMGFLLDGGQTITILGVLGNLVVVTIGNIVGGGFFVAFLYYYVYLRGK